MMCHALFSFYFDLILFRIDNNNNNNYYYYYYYNNYYYFIKITLKMFDI